MPVNWLYQGAWEDYFTVVQWDQRGAGKTAASNDAAAVTPTITIDRMTADGEELVAHLLQHYGKRKLFVMGHSWGTVIGLNIARARSEEHTSELQSLMRISYAVFCLKKKIKIDKNETKVADILLKREYKWQERST